MVKHSFYPFAFDPPPRPPPPPRHCLFEKRKTGIKTWFAGLAKSLAYCVHKLSSRRDVSRGSRASNSGVPVQKGKSAARVLMDLRMAAQEEKGAAAVLVDLRIAVRKGKSAARVLMGRNVAALTRRAAATTAAAATTTATPTAENWQR